MRALSLWQPHAAAIALGLKPYETRSWSTAYRGPLLIHAAKRPWNDAGDPAVCAWHEEAERRIADRCRDLVLEQFAKSGNTDIEHMKRAGAHLLARVLAFGAVVCVVTLAEDIPTHRLRGRISPEHEFWGDFSDGRQAFQLEEVRLLASPYPWRGSQGFFDVDIEIPEYGAKLAPSSAQQMGLFGG